MLSAHTSTLLSLVFLPLSVLYVGGLTNASQLGIAAGALLINLPIGWGTSFVWSYVLGLILLPLVYLAERLIAEPIRRDTMGWIAGSVVAIVGSAGGLFPFFAMFGATPAMGAAMPGGYVWILAAQVVGGVLGIAAAQAGGYLGSMGALRRRRRDGSGGTVRFTVWRLMALTAILAVLLSVVRLAGDFALPLVIAILVNCFVAWAIHRPVAWATNRWLDWRLTKRRAQRSLTRLATLPAQTS